MSTATLRATSDTPVLLRRALLADGVVSGATGLLLLLLADPLGDWFGLATLLLRLVGLSLLPYSASLFYSATRPVVSRSGVWQVIGINLIWAVASILLLFTGWIDPTGVGTAFIILQALIVAAFAELQYIALRRSA